MDLKQPFRYEAYDSPNGEYDPIGNDREPKTNVL
jgi:hypothetical protein